ncbi:hypothetical protein IY145_18985 [Methylosinus sp. H3A]|uniref:hypothetical protein n=1 Tax=Methylosinus sp. H3A TaxID=2785786 RepID=UPI0018C2E060|nr:hypothetical protein [Methylosinus sp. H3A]MBG0811440.1 hypothetical protein [Methylosinus sp. H3A]
MTTLSLPVFGERNRLWSGSLILAGAFFSLAFACAAPLAGFAAIAALTCSRRGALASTAAIWLANQLVGFAILHYPTDFETLAWGGALGVIALLCCETARLVARVAVGAGAPIAALVASFLVYEGVLFVITRAVGGDVSHYALAGVTRIFAVDACAFFGLWAFGLACAAVGAARSSALSSRGA